MDFIIEKWKPNHTQVYYPFRQRVFFAKVRDFHYGISENDYIINLQEEPAFASLYNACATLKKVMDISFGNNFASLKRYFKGYSVFVCPGSDDNVLLIAPNRELVIRLGRECPDAQIYRGKEFFEKEDRFEKESEYFDFHCKSSFTQVVNSVRNSISVE